MSLKSHLIATCFSLTRPSSGICSPIETAALHQFVCQCIPCYCLSSFALKCVWEWLLSLSFMLFSSCSIHVVPPSCVVVSSWPCISSEYLNQICWAVPGPLSNAAQKSNQWEWKLDATSAVTYIKFCENLPNDSDINRSLFSSLSKVASNQLTCAEPTHVNAYKIKI
jgi:hypothetical protein